MALFLAGANFLLVLGEGIHLPTKNQQVDRPSAVVCTSAMSFVGLRKPDKAEPQFWVTEGIKPSKHGPVKQPMKNEERSSKRKQ